MPPDSITYLNSVADIYKGLKNITEEVNGFMINNLMEVIPGFPFKSSMYRANYYSFLFIKKGKGHYIMDDQTFKYGSRTVYFANPGHIKSHEFNWLKDAYRIALTEEFLRTNVHSNIFDEFPFLLAEIVPPRMLSKSEFDDLEQIYLKIYSEYENHSTYKNQIIGNLFIVLLLKIKEKFWANYYPLEEGNRSSQIVKRFKQVLDAHYRDLAEGNCSFQYQAQDYAKEQNLHPGYLSTVIKSKTGKSISSWIAEKTTAQAKALLKHSTLSIKEIGFKLGYSETAHFSNFFKKNVGISPQFYRQEFNG